MTIRRNILICTLCFVLCTSISAHNSMVSIGVKGGGLTYMSSATDPSSSMQLTFGGSGTLDVRYAFYGSVTDNLSIGFNVGAGIGYGAASFKGRHTDTYTNFDYLGNQMDYKAYAAFKQIEQFAKAEVSLLASFCAENVIFNIGPRLMVPFATSSSLTISDASIDAYYPKYNVHVVNEQITGKLETPYANNQSQTAIPDYSLLVAFEIGYEWYFSSQSCLGFQLFADIGVWNSPSTVTGNPSPLIGVSPIKDASSPIPSVTVGGIGPFITDCRFFDFGVRVYYAFSVGSQSSGKQHYGRDSRSHHNRYMGW